jgi:hypothetical protein
MAPKKPTAPATSNHVCLHYKGATYPSYCVFYASDCSVDPSRPCAYSGPCSLTPGGSCTNTSACQSITFFRGQNKHVHPNTKNGNGAHYEPGDSPPTHNGVSITFSVLVKLALNPAGTRTCRVKLFRLRKTGDATMHVGIQVTNGAASETIDYDDIDFDNKCCRAKYNNRWYSVVLHRTTTHG